MHIFQKKSMDRKTVFRLYRFLVILQILYFLGLPFFPSHHALFGGLQQAEPLSLKMSRPSGGISSNGASNAISGMGHNNNNSNLPSGSSGGGISTRGRDSPADSVTTSAEPEDLSLRASPKEELLSSPKDLVMVGDRALSSGAGTPTGEDAGSTGAGSTSQTQNWSFEEQFKQVLIVIFLIPESGIL